MLQISYNLNYPTGHLENLLFPLFNKHYSIDSLRCTIESANHIWCVYENDKCVACALITDIGSYGGLYMILFGVSESIRRHGIGTRLLNHIIKWSQRNRNRFIYLHTEYDNDNAIRLYKKAGFKTQFKKSNFIDELPHFESDVLPMLLLIQ